MNTYLLSESAKRWTWHKWKKEGGCGLSDYATAMVSRSLRTAHWDSMTLGTLQDACIVAGRETARFGRDHLKLRNFAVVEYENI
jgi:hypothetical protein